MMDASREERDRVEAAAPSVAEAPAKANLRVKTAITAGVKQLVKGNGVFANG